MSLEFVIIPITSTFIASAKDIQYKLENAIVTKLNIQFDTNYDATINTRINKWKKEEVNIIVIDDTFDGTNNITIRFSDKRSIPEVMDVDEFIELMSSFEDKEQHDTTDKFSEDENVEDENVEDENVDDENVDNVIGNCIIM